MLQRFLKEDHQDVSATFNALHFMLKRFLKEDHQDVSVSFNTLHPDPIK